MAQIDPLKRLSPEEATELAARVAELTKAGLPLGPGLRAMAGELSGRRLRRVLRSLADRLEAGDDLVAALESQGRSLPTHLRGVILAGVRSGRLSEVLEEFVDLERSQLDLRRRVWLSLAYPFILLLSMTALASAAAHITPSFAKIFGDFQVHLPVMTVVAINTAGAVKWFFVGLVWLSLLIPFLLWLAPGASWIWPLLYRVPMFGPLLRWSHLAQFGRLMGLLLGQQIPLPDALRLSAAGLRDANLARGCRRVADGVERGRPLAESIAARRQFPRSLVPVIEWGQRAPAMADAFSAAAEMFEGRARSQGSLLAALLLPLMFLTVVVFVGAVVLAMFLPLIKLIESLSG